MANVECEPGQRLRMDMTMMPCQLTLPSQGCQAATFVPVLPYMAMQMHMQPQPPFCAFAMPVCPPASAPAAAAAADCRAIGGWPQGQPAVHRGAVGRSSDWPEQAVEVPLKHNVRRLSREYHGCRRVQDALEAATTEATRVEIAEELRGNVWHATQCPNANHVIQKCITTMKAESIQFVIDEITRKGPEATCKVARNQYGCRVLQRLLEHCLTHQVDSLVDDLLTEKNRLCMHIYGNYVMRHVLEYAPFAQRHRLAEHVCNRVRELGTDERACAVLCAALAHASREDRKAIAAAVVEDPGLLELIAATRHGHVAVESVIRLLGGGTALAEVARRLWEATPPLGQSRFGRSVLAALGEATARCGLSSAEAPRQAAAATTAAGVKAARGGSLQ